MRKLFLFVMAAMCCAMTVSAIEGALPGKFTVNDKGDQVQFHNAFMRHITEHTYVTSCPSQMDLGITKLYYDFFSWGTGDNPNYWGFVDNFVDWGDNLCCDIEPHIWRTLSADEWQYILSGREHAEYLCGLAKVTYQEKDIKVLMLFPDDIYNGDSNDGLNLPDGIMFSSYKNEGNKFSGSYNNAYTSEEWTKLEEAGAVAFPETGGVYFEFVDEYTMVNMIFQNIEREGRRLFTVGLPPQQSPARQ